MSKQHHFVVSFDTQTQRWDIDYAMFDEDRPIFDDEKMEWLPINGSDDIERDSRLYEELRRRLSAPYEWPICGAEFMGGAICVLPEDHSSSHRSGE